MYRKTFLTVIYTGVEGVGVVLTGYLKLLFQCDVNWSINLFIILSINRHFEVGRENITCKYNDV